MYFKLFLAATMPVIAYLKMEIDKAVIRSLMENGEQVDRTQTVRKILHDYLVRKIFHDYLVSYQLYPVNRTRSAWSENQLL